MQEQAGVRARTLLAAGALAHDLHVFGVAGAVRAHEADLFGPKHNHFM